MTDARASTMGDGIWETGCAQLLIGPRRGHSAHHRRVWPANLSYSIRQQSGPSSGCRRCGFGCSFDCGDDAMHGEGILEVRRPAGAFAQIPGHPGIEASDVPTLRPPASPNGTRRGFPTAGISSRLRVPPQWKVAPSACGRRNPTPECPQLCHGFPRTGRYRPAPRHRDNGWRRVRRRRTYR